MMCLWALAALSASAQMKLISREKVEQVSNPSLSPESEARNSAESQPSL